MNGSTTRIGVIVPARNERTVIVRKLRNLARVEWPACASGHRVVVVDDASEDGSGAVVASVLDELRALRPEVSWSCVRGAGLGKARAIRAGREALADVDLVVLTDADVVLRRAALIALVEAFQEDPELALACGAQEFVRSLAGDGSTSGSDGGPPVPAGGLYDRLTARVRAFESRGGRVFSVHGQLLAWRGSAPLLPRPGLAADDIDLMLFARAGGGRVRLVAGARFLEVKPRRGRLLDGQRKRRAEGYFQILRGWDGRCPLGTGLLDRVQWAFYRWVPAAAPFGLVALVAVSIGLAVRGSGATAGLAAAAIWCALAVTPHGREVIGLARVIAAARRAAPAPIDAGFDRWEPPRG